MSLLLPLAAFIAVAGLGLAWHRRHPRPFPVAWTGMLEYPLRRWILEPGRFAASLALAPNERILEIGPGGGAVTAALLAHPAAPAVTCLDVQIDMLRKVRGRFASAGPRCPATVCADGAALPLASGSFDCVVLVTVLGEIPDRAGALRECARVLRPGGLLAVAETLPDPDFLPRARVLREAREAGFAAEEGPPIAIGTVVGTWGAFAQHFRRPTAS